MSGRHWGIVRRHWGIVWAGDWAGYDGRISDSVRAKDIVLLDYFNFYNIMTNTL